MGRKKQVFLALVLLCHSQCLHRCESNLINASFKKSPTLKPTVGETASQKVSSIERKNIQATPSLALESQKTNGRLENPLLTSSMFNQHFTRPSSTKLSSKRRKSLNINHKLRLIMKQSSRFFNRLKKLQTRDKTLPVDYSSKTSRIPFRYQSALKSHSGVSKITVKSRPNRPLIKPDNGGIVMPFKIKDIRKKKWCKMVSFKQKVHHKGCESVQIDNNACYGQCLSFYVPRLFQSCSSCLPATEITIPVKLNCPGKYPEQITKRVKIVDSCRCKATSCKL